MKRCGARLAGTPITCELEAGHVNPRAGFNAPGYWHFAYIDGPLVCGRRPSFCWRGDGSDVIVTELDTGDTAPIGTRAGSRAGGD